MGNRKKTKRKSTKMNYSSEAIFDKCLIYFLRCFICGGVIAWKNRSINTIARAMLDWSIKTALSPSLWLILIDKNSVFIRSRNCARDERKHLSQFRL